MKKIIIYTDGGARGNPGPAGIGAVIQNADGTIVKEISEYIGEQTNNYAEYEALLRALGEAKKIFGKKLREIPVEARADSELMVRQLNGVYKVKDAALREKYADVYALRVQDFGELAFVHVPREQNKRADELVNEALDNRS